MKDRRCDTCNQHEDGVLGHTCFGELMTLWKYEWIKEHGCIYNNTYIELGEGSEVEKIRLAGW